MFIFYLLGVGLPCRLIFCQFWLCEEAQCVYLRCHLGSKSRERVFRNNYKGHMDKTKGGGVEAGKGGGDS